MKFKFISSRLTKIICAFVYFNSNLILSLSYHMPQASKHLQHYPHYRHPHHRFQRQHETVHFQNNEAFLAKESKSLGYGTRYSNKPIISDYCPHHHHHAQQKQQYYFSDARLNELTESAKDPKNLRNGIYHDGAVTYDLGLPNYEILNPYDAPEIITSDHPHYHEQLNQIERANSFAIEDFGVTSIPDSDTISETTTLVNATTATSVDDVITTELPETTTRNKQLSATAKTSTTPSTMETFNISIKNDIEKHLSETKEKLRILHDQLDLKNREHKIFPSPNVTDLKFVIVRKHDDQLKKQKPTPFRIHKPQILSKFHSPLSFPQEFRANKPKADDNYAKKSADSKFAKSFYGQSVLLPAEHVRFPYYIHRFRNALHPPAYYNQHIAYPSYSNQHTIHSPESADRQNHLYSYISSPSLSEAAESDLNSPISSSSSYSAVK